MRDSGVGRVRWHGTCGGAAFLVDARRQSVPNRDRLCGDRISRTSTIESVREKSGRTGALVFVRVRHEIRANDAPEVALTEHHDIVYRAAASAKADAFEMGLTFPDFADPPAIDKAEVDWGDGGAAENVAFADPLAADAVRFEHAYARAGDYVVRLVLHPTADAAPIHVHGTVTIEAPAHPPAIYLPAVIRGPLGGDPAEPAAFVGRRDEVR